MAYGPGSMCITQNTAQTKQDDEKIGMISCATDLSVRVVGLHSAHSCLIIIPTHRAVAGCLDRSEAQWKMEQALS